MEGTTHWVVEELTAAGDWKTLDAATDRVRPAEALRFARKQDAEAWMLTLIDFGVTANLLRAAERPIMDDPEATPPVDFRPKGNFELGVRVGQSEEGLLRQRDGRGGSHWLLEGDLADVIGECRHKRLGQALNEVWARLEEGFKAGEIVRVDGRTVKRATSTQAAA